MAVYKLFPTKDASLYSVSQSVNTGLDEILDLSTYIANGVAQTNRALVKYSDLEMDKVINNIKSNGASIILTTSLIFTPEPSGVNGVYNNIPLIGSLSNANNALATITIAVDGTITSAIVTNGGSGYKVGDVLKIESGLLGLGSLETLSSPVLNKILEYDVDLRLSSAVVTGLSQDATVETYPISQSWNMGTGRLFDNPPTQNGASWVWNDFSGSIVSSIAQKWQTSGFSAPGVTPYATASFPDPSVQPDMSGGGTWYYANSSGISYTMKQLFSYSNPTDLNIRVTPSVKEQMLYQLNPSEGQKNEGFIVKQTGSQEFLNSINTQATFKFFSIDTNTIYPPQLEIKWDDSLFQTGSNNNGVLDTNQSLISVYNNNGIYYSQSIAEFRIGATPQYPIRQFQTASQYNTNHFLPEDTSLYAIKDSETNEMIIDFDSNYTKISADSVSSYFTVYMNGLEPERDYTILIKTLIGGVVNVFDEDIRFKVVNG
tara:strand:- start:5130 stop:6590 length:1461 start_codon:yes stop_codon:yes gene_type:complete